MNILKLQKLNSKTMDKLITDYHGLLIVIVLEYKLNINNNGIKFEFYINW